MARARNIKPGFYANEDLAECSIWARFIFPGLWMLADREGRLEYRPKKIKGELLRFDSVDAEPLLLELQALGFILIYDALGKKYIQIIKFRDHQNPHYKEAKSTIPAPDGWMDSLGLDAHSSNDEPGDDDSMIDGETLGSTENEAPMIGGQTGLIPDSGFLIPDSGFSDPPIGGSGSSRDRGERKAPSAAAGIAMTLIGWERERGKVPRGISASNAQVMDLAAMHPTPDELRKAYDLAVADRLATGDANPINAGFLIALLGKVRNPPKPREPKPIPLHAMDDNALNAEGRRHGLEARPGEDRHAFIARIQTAQAIAQGRVAA